MGSIYAKSIDEIKETLAEIAPQVKCIPALKEAMADMRTEVAVMVKTVNTLHETCPHREDIALAKANHKKLGEVEKKAQRNEVGIAKIAVSAIGGGTVVALVQELIKALA